MQGAEWIYPFLRPVGRERRLQAGVTEIFASPSCALGGCIGAGWTFGPLNMDKAHSNSLASPAEAQREGGGAEKRKAVRYPVSAAAEIVEARSRTRLSARASDISLSGCYLDAINLFPVGAAVALRLTNEARTFECEARVTYSLPGMGMGMVFTKISPSQAAVLRAWIAELAGQASDTSAVDPEIEFESEKPQPSDGQYSDGWRDVLYELVSLLQRKGILGETEANTLRSRIAR